MSENTYEHKNDRIFRLRRRLADADARLYELQEEGRLTEARVVINDIARMEQEVEDLREAIAHAQ